MTEPAHPRKSRTGRRLLVVLVAACLLAAALIGSAPALLSTAAGQRFLLERIARRSGLRIQAEKLRLGWFDGAEILGLQVAKPGVFTARVDRVTVEKGLLSALNDRELGLVVLDRPEVSLLPASPRPPRAPSAPPRFRRGQSLEDILGAPRSAFNWPSWSVSVRIRDGAITLPVAGPGALPERIEAVEAEASLVPRPPRMEIHATARNASTGGVIESRMVSSAPREEGITLGDVRHEGSLQCAGLQLQPVLLLLPGLAEYAASTGQMGCAVSFSGSGLRNMTFRSVANLSQVKLREVFSSGEEPLVDPLRLEFGGVMTSGVPVDLSVNVTAPFLRIQANQDPKAAGIGDRVNLIASVDIPRLADLLPRTLRLRSDTVIEEGALQVRGELALGTNTMVRLLAELPRLKGRLDNEPVLLDEPMLAEADIRWGADGLDLKRLRVKSGFANLEGAGGAGQLSAEGWMDLAKAVEQARTFLQLGPSALDGRLQFKVDTAWDPADYSLTGVSLSAQARGFSWASGRGARIEKENANLDLTLSRGPLPDWSSCALSLVVSNRAVNVVAGGNGFDLRRMPGAEPSITVTGWADLARMGGWFPGLSALQGTLEVAPAQVAFSGGDWRIPELQLRLRQPAVVLASGPVPLPDVELEGGVSLARASRRIEWRDLRIGAGPLRLRGERFAVPVDPFRGDGLSGVFSVDAPLKELLDLVRRFTPLPPLRDAAGHLRLEARADRGLLSAALHAGELRLDLPGLAKPVLEKSVSARATLSVSTNGVWHADAFEFSSSALGVVGAVQVVNRAGREMLEVNGDLSYDLSALCGYLPGFAASGVVVSGQDSRPFKLGLPLLREAAGAPPVHFEMDLTADRLAFGDLILEQLRVPLRLADNRLAVDATARLGDATLSLSPRVAIGPPAELRWEPKPPVLDRIPLTDALAARLLSRIHPVFANAAGVSGRSSLHVDQMRILLAADWQAGSVVKGRLVLEDAAFGADGWMREAMELAKIRETTLTLGSSVIEFELANGRVYTSPVSVLAGKTRVTIHGHMGLDGTLHYAVVVPVTEELVGRSLFRRLPAQSFTIPLGGTLRKPALDRERLKESLRQLMRDAARKALEEEADDALRKLLERQLRSLEKREADPEP